MKNPPFPEETAILESVRALLDEPGDQDWPARCRELAGACERLLSAARRATELEAMLGDVERIMRHDLKAPLNGIINFPELVRLAGPVNAEQEEFLDQIVDQGWTMLRQIDLSLALYRIEAGTYAFSPRPVDLDGLIRQAARDLANLASALDVRLTLRLPAGATALGDDLLCHCLVSNVLRNAIEASPRRGEVTVDLAPGPEGMRLAVCNAGAASESQRACFCDEHAARDGTRGAGLARSARLIARAMGGEIRLDLSEPGRVAQVLTLGRA